MKPLVLNFLLVSMLAPMSPLLAAEDAIYLEETVITGNQELPKVLYILPWREMQSEALPRRTLNFNNQSMLAPIYPDEQKRQLAYQGVLDTARQKQNPNSDKNGLLSNGEDQAASQRTGFTKRLFKKIF